MSSVVFDQAAAYYDSSRGYPAGVAERIQQAIVAQTGAGPASRFLELGVGTGRMALPFVQAGYDYAGIDLSRPMMEAFRHKVAAVPEPAERGPRLVQGDVARLPIVDGVFDIIVVVHVLHLITQWREALAEARRVLRKPGGCLLVGRDDVAKNYEAPAIRRVVEQWYTILGGLGVERTDQHYAQGPDGSLPDGDEQKLRSFLDALDGHPYSLTLLEYPARPLSPRAVALHFVIRTSSRDWLLSDEVHAEAARRLSVWLDHECPDPDAEISGSAQFRATVARW